MHLNYVCIPGASPSVWEGVAATDAGGMGGMQFSVEGIKHDCGVLQQKRN